MANTKHQNCGPAPKSPDVKLSKRYGRKESDFFILQQIDTYDVDAENLGQQVKKFFQHELSRTDGAYLNLEDQWFFRETYLLAAGNRPFQYAVHAVPHFFRAFVLRAKIQSLCLSLFLSLNEEGLISTRGLEEPVGLESPFRVHIPIHADVWGVAQTLYCFGFKESLGPHKLRFAAWFHEHWYGSPFLWLATMIVRGALTEDFCVILARIGSLNELGELDIRNVECWWPRGRRLVADRNANIVERRPEGQAQAFGFWFPHGLGPDYEIPDVCRNFHKEFGRVEKLFFNHFKLETQKDLPPEYLPCNYLGRGN